MVSGGVNPPPAAAAPLVPASVPVSVPAFVTGTGTGTGTSGSVAVEFTPDVSGALPLTVSGLVRASRQPNPDDPGSPTSGFTEPGEDTTYLVTVPAGLRFLRIDLDSIGDSANLDLNAYVEVPGDESVQFESQTGAADEQINLPNPIPGDYEVVVSTVSGYSDFTLDTYLVPAGPGEGALTATPANVLATAGVTASYTLTWAGLQSGPGYLGLVEYGENARTVLEVDPGAASIATAVNVTSPTILGVPEEGRTLRAKTGTWTPRAREFFYQWQANGTDVFGATEARYRVNDSIAGATLTVKITARAPGLIAGTAVSGGVYVKEKVFPTVTLSQSTIGPGEQTVATVAIRSFSAVSGVVELRVGALRYPVTLDADQTGQVTLLGLPPRSYKVTAFYPGSDIVAPVESDPVRLRVKR